SRSFILAYHILYLRLRTAAVPDRWPVNLERDRRAAGVSHWTWGGFVSSHASRRLLPAGGLRGMLAVANALLVIRQLAFEFGNTGIDTGVGVALVVIGDEHVAVLAIDDHLDAGGVLVVVKDHLDLLDPIIVPR